MSIEMLHTLKDLNEWYKRKFCDRQDDIVLGEGCINPKIVIVGEAPGKEEVQKRRPFVGKAGKNLDFFLNELGIQRNEVYITNAIKYRLKKISPKSGGFINRPATTDDILSSMDMLHKEISMLGPNLIITLGNVPLRAITTDTGLNIGDMHGKMTTANVSGTQVSLYPLYHPASIIYNPTLKNIYLEDILNLKTILN